MCSENLHLSGRLKYRFILKVHVTDVNSFDRIYRTCLSRI